MSNTSPASKRQKRQLREDFVHSRNNNTSDDESCDDAYGDHHQSDEHGSMEANNNNDTAVLRLLRHQQEWAWGHYPRRLLPSSQVLTSTAPLHGSTGSSADAQQPLSPFLQNFFRSTLGKDPPGAASSTSLLSRKEAKPKNAEEGTTPTNTPAEGEAVVLTTTAFDETSIDDSKFSQLKAYQHQRFLNYKHLLDAALSNFSNNNSNSDATASIVIRNWKEKDRKEYQRLLPIVLQEQELYNKALDVFWILNSQRVWRTFESSSSSSSIKDKDVNGLETSAESEDTNDALVLLGSDTSACHDNATAGSSRTRRKEQPIQQSAKVTTTAKNLTTVTEIGTTGCNTSLFFAAARYGKCNQIISLPVVVDTPSASSTTRGASAMKRQSFLDSIEAVSVSPPLLEMKSSNTKSEKQDEAETLVEGVNHPSPPRETKDYTLPPESINLDGVNGTFLQLTLPSPGTKISNVKRSCLDGNDDDHRSTERLETAITQTWQESLIENDSVAFELAEHHKADILTTEQTLRCLLRTDANKSSNSFGSGNDSSSSNMIRGGWMIPAFKKQLSKSSSSALRNKQMAKRDTVSSRNNKSSMKSTGGSTGGGGTILVLDVPVPNSTNVSPREHIEDRFEEALHEMIFRGSSCSSSPSCNGENNKTTILAEDEINAGDDGQKGIHRRDMSERATNSLENCKKVDENRKSKRHRYTLLRIPATQSSVSSSVPSSRSLRVLVRSSCLTSFAGHDDVADESDAASQQMHTIKIHAKAEFFPERGIEEFTSSDKSIWVLDHLLLKQDRAETLTVGAGESSSSTRVAICRFNPITFEVLGWEEPSMAHAVTTQPSQWYDKSGNNNRTTFRYGAHGGGGKSVEYRWRLLSHVLTAAMTIGSNGKHLMCYPSRNGTGSCMGDKKLERVSWDACSVHISDEKGNINLMEHVDCEIPVFGADSFGCCRREWCWETPDRIPYTFPPLQETQP